MSDLDMLHHKFMNEIVETLKFATYPLDKYSRDQNRTIPVSQEEYEEVKDKCHYTICFSINNQMMGHLNNIKFNPTCLLLIKKYFHLLPDFETVGFPLTESTFRIGNTYSNFTPVANKLGGKSLPKTIVEIIRPIFHTGEHYMSTHQQNILNQIIAIDGLYIAYYKFLKGVIKSSPPLPEGSSILDKFLRTANYDSSLFRNNPSSLYRVIPKSPDISPPPLVQNKTKKSSKQSKPVRNPSETKKLRNQRATKYPNWWLNAPNST